jgi:hypothetical protein
MSQSYPKSPRGLLARLRIRLFGELDPIEVRLREMSRQGTGMARIAHMCALALIVLFSAGSLVALGGDSLKAIVVGWASGQVDVPSAISLSVSTLLVACFDVGMVYAASVLRILNSRRAGREEKWLHWSVMIIVAILESATYGYMSARYEHPGNFAIWALILARAAAAPLLSVYLSMARAMPILPRDVLSEVELLTGTGVLRRTLERANDSGASLSKLIAMYESASVMSDQDRNRLRRLIQTVQSDEVEEVTALVVDADEKPGPRFPTGGGSPAGATVVESDLDSQTPTVLQAAMAGAQVVRLRPAARGDSTASGRRRRLTPQQEEAKAFAILDKAGYDPGTGRAKMSNAAFRAKLGVGARKARAYKTRWLLRQTNKYATELEVSQEADADSGDVAR